MTVYLESAAKFIDCLAHDSEPGPDHNSSSHSCEDSNSDQRDLALAQDGNHVLVHNVSDNSEANSAHDAPEGNVVRRHW